MFIPAMIVEQEGKVAHAVILRLRLVKHHATKVRQGIEQSGLTAGIATIHNTNLLELNAIAHFVDVLITHAVIICRHKTDSLPLPDAVEILYLKLLYHSRRF